MSEKEDFFGAGAVNGTRVRVKRGWWWTGWGPFSMVFLVFWWLFDGSGWIR